MKNKKIYNWMTHILGMVMMIAGAFMIYNHEPITYIILMFGLGATSFMSFNKTGNMFIEGLGFLLRNNK